MRSITRVTLSSTFFIIAVSAGCFGQINFSGYEIGVNAGTLVYQGDLTPTWYGSTKALKPAIGVYVSKALDPYFSLRVNFTHGKISADESRYAEPEWRQFRNFKFSSSINEVAGLLVFNPYGNNTRRLSPYVFAGAGVTFLNVKRDWSGFNTTYFDIKSVASESLAADTLRTVPRAVAVLPVGIGLKYMLGQRFAINAEGTWRFTSSDYLDGFKYRAPANKRDAYYGATLGTSFRFGKDKNDCPAVAGR